MTDAAAQLRESLRRLRGFMEEAGSWPDATYLEKRLESQIAIYDLGRWECELRTLETP